MKANWGTGFAVAQLIWQISWVSSATAQAELTQDLQNWDTVKLQAAFGPGKRILGYMEAQSRIGNLDNSGTKNDDFSQLLLRPAVGYQLNRHISIWQGYAWVPIFQPRPLDENRIFQQLQLEGNIKKLYLTNRSRLEERWIEGTNHTAVRYRNMTRMTYPLGKSQRWALVGSDEFFINLNTIDNGPTSGFDQNRLFVGLNRKLSEHINAEAGYMNQWINKKDPVADHMNHIIVLTLNLNL